MFGNKDEDQDDFSENNVTSNESRETVVGSSVKLQGDLISQNNIVVHGEVVGKIKTDEDISIGDGAVIKGNAIAKNVVIAGKIEGDVVAKEKTEISNTGKIFGNITTKLISISEGAIFTGQCEMSEEVEEKSKTEDSTSEESSETDSSENI